jgi:hypothetical protein
LVAAVGADVAVAADAVADKAKPASVIVAALATWEMKRCMKTPKEKTKKRIKAGVI